MSKTLLFVALLCPLAFAQQSQTYDVLIRNGTVYDGSGAAPQVADVAINGDKIAGIGKFQDAQAKLIIDARGQAVAPGFINMLSWATESLIVDGRSQSDIRQGVTTEIFGEGWSMGPVNQRMKERMVQEQGDIKYDIKWNTLAEYLKYLEKKGIAPNVASFIGAATIREYAIGLEDKPPTAEQLQQMRELVRKEMENGALGIGSSLIYAPGFYASTEELIELCKVAAKYQGKYISHMRSEGNRLIESVDELLRISREAGVPAEIYHLKAAGQENWPKIDRVIEMVEQARHNGQKITADMYMYTAGATGLNATMPPWVLSGGQEAWFKRLRDPEQRKKIADAMRTPSNDWENLFLGVGSPDHILLVSFKSEKLKPLTGKTVAEVAKMRGTDPATTIMDLVLEDQSSIGAIYFLMSEDNVRKQIKLPWVSLGSDEESQAPEGVFLKSRSHPRAYGNVARFLGRYVRDEKLIPLEDAVRRLSGLPATNLGLDHRGFIKSGMFADVVVFDPKTIQDHATYEQSQQYATGVKHVFVNGVQVIKDGEHTGATPGRALRGPGAGHLSGGSPQR